MSHFLKEVGKVHNSKETSPFLNQNEFCDRVQFTFGVPLIVLDFIDTLTGSCFISDLHKYMSPPRDSERFPAGDYEL